MAVSVPLRLVAVSWRSPVLVGTTGHVAVHSLAPRFPLLYKFGSVGTGPLQFTLSATNPDTSRSWGMCFSPRNTLLLADEGNDRVQVHSLLVLTM